MSQYSHRGKVHPLILLGVICFCSVVWQPSDASAQRLLQRLRSRFRGPTPPQQPAPPSQNPAQPGVGNPQTASQPRILSRPVLPGSTTPNADDSPANAPAKSSLGIEVTPGVFGPYQGLRITGFSEQSKADEAGLRNGDLIVSIAETRVNSLADASRAIPISSKTDKIQVQLFRDGKLYKANVPLIKATQQAAKPPLEDDEQLADSENDTRQPQPGQPTLARPRASLGIQAQDALPKRGVLVVAVTPGNVADIAGLKEADRIVSFDGRLVRNVDDLVREVALGTPGKVARLGVVRDDQMLNLTTELGGPGGKPINAAVANGRQESSKGDNSDDTGQSVLGSVGSALGGLFGGQSKPKTDEETKPNPPPAKSNEELPAPALREPLQKPSSSSTDALPAPSGPSASLENDPLALPED